MKKIRLLNYESSRLNPIQLNFYYERPLYSQSRRVFLNHQTWAFERQTERIFFKRGYEVVVVMVPMPLLPCALLLLKSRLDLKRRIQQIEVVTINTGA